jgi:hypothetical protein
VNAFWGAPGGAAVINLLLFAGLGRPPVRWFSQINTAGAGINPRYRWSAAVLAVGSSLAGVPLPGPRYVPFDSPLPIAAWMEATLRSGGTPHLYTYVSAAVQLCQQASRTGIDLRGAKLTITGEPITGARLATIEESGAQAASNYGMNEAGGFIGYSCLAPETPDDVHVFDDLHALVQVDEDSADALPRGAILISSLRQTAPLILLNVSTGDHGVISNRSCGCPLERHGWRTHLHTIRSFEKLTAGATAFHRTDVVRVLEEVLPARFGGGPTHYQLVDEEAAGGQPRLRLLVDPVVGPVDPRAVADTFLAALAGDTAAGRVDALVWRQLSVLEVERRPPERSASGKVLHLHIGGQRRVPYTDSTV